MNTTIIIVSYKQTELIKAAHESIRKFYPTITVIIIDGSPADSDCWNYLHSIQDPNTHVHTLEYNIGHGRGLHMGIGMATTEYVLLMDSDVEMQTSHTIELLQEFVKINKKQFGDLVPVYGAGKVVFVDENGHNKYDGFQYLHPHFALVNREMYFKHEPLINHGAPFLKTMIELQKHHFMLLDAPIDRHITHHERGTRAINPPEFHPSNWDKV